MNPRTSKPDTLIDSVNSYLASRNAPPNAMNELERELGIILDEDLDALPVPTP
jgi:hypothetical protein